MSRFLQTQLLERLLFTLVIVGILLIGYSVYRVITINIALSNNLAQQIHDSGEELQLQTAAEGRGIVASDIERRELLQERAQMYIAAGAGLVMLGIGWLGYDFLGQRRKNGKVVQAAQTS